jgi:hypothetical protein
MPNAVVPVDRLAAWRVVTTGNRLFVECKSEKHWAKDLPSVILDKENSTSCISTNSSLPNIFYRILDKKNRRHDAG